MSSKTLIQAIIILSPLFSFAGKGQLNLDLIVSKKVEPCEKTFPLNSFILLAAGAEEELKTNKVLASQISLFAETGELVARQNLVADQKECVQIAESLLAGSLLRKTLSDIGLNIEKAAKSIKIK
jgi:hypothetical protein